MGSADVYFKAYVCISPVLFRASFFLSSALTFPSKRFTRCSLGARKQYGYSIPVRLRAGTSKLFVISSPEQIATIFKSSRGLTTKPSAILALKRLLGAPDRAIPLYAADDSGAGVEPRPGSKTRPEHRIHYFQAKAAHKHLSGQGLVAMSERYMAIWKQNMDAQRIQDEWTELPDLYAFLRVEVFRAAVEAMCGSYLLAAHPNFIEDFWRWDSYVPMLLRGFPRWLYPEAYRTRDRLLANIKDWHRAGREHCDHTKLGPDDPDWDPYYGSKLVRARAAYSDQMDAMDDDAQASEDLGLIFAYVSVLSAVFFSCVCSLLFATGATMPTYVCYYYAKRGHRAFSPLTTSCTVAIATPFRRCSGSFTKPCATRTSWRACAPRSTRPLA